MHRYRALIEADCRWNARFCAEFACLAIASEEVEVFVWVVHVLARARAFHLGEPRSVLSPQLLGFVLVLFDLLLAQVDRNLLVNLLLSLRLLRLHLMSFVALRANASDDFEPVGDTGLLKRCLTSFWAQHFVDCALK